MSGARDHLDPADHRSPAAGPHRAPETGHALEPAPALKVGPWIAGRADPRLAHSGAGAGLLHLQRTAGNAAVSSLVAPTLQRAVSIDEVGIDMTNPYDEAPATEPAGETGATDAGATAAGGPVTSDGATTTISGAAINLEAAITQTGGIIRAGTIIADNVIGSNYTPGAGNVW